MKDKLVDLYQRATRNYGEGERPFALIAVVAIVLLFALLAMPVQAYPPKFYLFGDSLSAVPESWVEVINDYDYAQIHNISRNGLRMVDITIPDWIRCGQAGVIIRLGTNDAGNMVTDQDYELKLREHLDTLQAKECAVWLALPLHVTQLGAGIDERTHAKRVLTERIAREYQNVTLLDFPYSTTETTDGLHPTSWEQFWTAVWFLQELALLGGV